MSGSAIIREDLTSICKRMGSSLGSFEGSTLLVAGGTGFLPSFFVDAVAYANEHLFKEPCRILCVDNFITGDMGRLEHLKDNPHVVFLRQDITEPLLLDGAIDYVIHAASIASPPIYRKYPLRTVDVNVFGTRNLLDLAVSKGTKSFLYLSSSEIYGDPTPEDIPTAEVYRGNVSCTGPRACYDESKRLAETLCSIYASEHHVPVKIVRPFNVYGPRLSLNDGRIVPDILKNGLQGKPLVLYSDGRATRSFCYVADAVVAMLLILLSSYDGEAFNVGNDEEVSIGKLAQEASSLFVPQSEIRFETSDDVHYLTDNPVRRCPDLAKVKQSIPWQPIIGLNEGLRRTIAWYQGRVAVCG